MEIILKGLIDIINYFTAYLKIDHWFPILSDTLISLRNFLF